jgi:hypothetical protein
MGFNSAFKGLNKYFDIHLPLGIVSCRLFRNCEQNLGHGEEGLRKLQRCKRSKPFSVGKFLHDGCHPWDCGDFCVEYLNNLAPHQHGNGVETFLLEKIVSTDVVPEFAGNL